AEVARERGAPLDVVLARKIGAPYQPELAIGAVVMTTEPIRVLDQQAVRYLDVSPEYVEAESSRQLEEIRRRLDDYREGRFGEDLRGKTVIIVDDGIATGYTVRAAVAGLRELGPARLVVAVPVAPPSSCAELREVADE